MLEDVCTEAGGCGKFIQTCPAKRTPVSPVFGMPKTFIMKDVLKENGLGIHVHKKGSAIVSSGALAVQSGKKTGRSPLDKRVYSRR